MEERPIVAGKKMLGEALEVKLHAQHPCEISAVPFLKNSCFTEPAQPGRSLCFPSVIMEQTLGIEQGDFLSQTEQKHTLVFTSSDHLELL